MRIFLRIGLGVCLWIIGIIGGVFTIAMLGEAKRDGFIDPLFAFVIFGGSWGLLYLLYRYIGNRWDSMMGWGRFFVTLPCLAIFAGAGWIAWSVQEIFVGLLIAILVVASVIAFFAGGGGAYLPGGSKDWGKADPDLIGIRNALDDIKKKL